MVLMQHIKRPCAVLYEHLHRCCRQVSACSTAVLTVPFCSLLTLVPAKTLYPLADSCCTTRFPVLPVAPATNTCGGYDAVKHLRRSAIATGHFHWHVQCRQAGSLCKLTVLSLPSASTLVACSGKIESAATPARRLRRHLSTGCKTSSLFRSTMICSCCSVHKSQLT